MTDGAPSYEIGRWYRVPCVKARRQMEDLHPVHHWHGEWIPIIGPEHRDAEIINFPFLHWHVDWRFVSKRVFDGVKSSRMDGHVLSLPFMRHPAHAGIEAPDLTLMSAGVELRRKQCKRAMPTWQDVRQLVKWLKQLQESCAGLKMKNMVCPHRGIPLKGCRQEGGVVECPGHGLRWNVTTGEQVI